MQCTAHRRDGTQCHNHAIRGAHVCRMHGGTAPQVQAAARRRLEAEQAAEAVVTFGLPRDVDPHVALLEEVHRTAGHVAWLASKIGDFDSDEHLWQMNAGPGGASQVVPSVWVDLYSRERAHLARVCKAAVDAGVQERQVRLAEQQGRLLATVIEGVLTDLGVDDHPGVGAVVRKHLELVSTFSAN